MRREVNPITILLAEDDPDDRMLTQEAFEENRLSNRLDMVEDGVDALDYLNRRGKFAALKGAPLPGVILLDLNMPRKGGREVLLEIKADPALQHIPVVVLTTSNADEDIIRTYELGVNSFITKPVTFEALVDVIRAFGNYWLQIVELPNMRKAK